MARLIDNFRKKYPEYNNIDDVTLAKKVVAKYPQYSQMLDEVSGNKFDFNKGVEAVLQTPEKIAPSIPTVASMVGGASTSGIASSAIGGAFGRMGGQQLKAELEQTPLKAVSRIAEGAVPGISMLTKGLSPEQQMKVTQTGIKEAPVELALGILGGLVGRGIKGISRFRTMGKDFTLNKAGEIADALDTVRKSYGSPISKIVDDFADQPIKISEVNTVLKGLPKNVIGHIRKNSEIFGVKFLPNKSPLPTLRNLQNLKEALGDFMTTKDWIEAGKAEKSVIKQSYGKLRDLMVDAKPELGKALKDYHTFMDEVFSEVNPRLRDAAWKVREMRVRSTLKPGAERSRQIGFEKLAKESKRAEQAINDIRKFLSRQGLKKSIKKSLIPAGLTATAGYGLSKLLRKSGGY